MVIVQQLVTEANDNMGCTTMTISSFNNSEAEVSAEVTEAKILLSRPMTFSFVVTHDRISFQNQFLFLSVDVECLTLPRQRLKAAHASSPIVGRLPTRFIPVSKCILSAFYWNNIYRLFNIFKVWLWWTLNVFIKDLEIQLGRVRGDSAAILYMTAWGYRNQALSYCPLRMEMSRSKSKEACSNIGEW